MSKNDLLNDTKTNPQDTQITDNKHFVNVQKMSKAYPCPTY